MLKIVLSQPFYTLSEIKGESTGEWYNTAIQTKRYDIS